MDTTNCGKNSAHQISKTQTLQETAEKQEDNKHKAPQEEIV